MSGVLGRLRRILRRTHRRADLPDRLARALEDAKPDLAPLAAIDPPPRATGAPPPRWPAVSVVTPTYNRAAILPDAIATVRAQTFTEWELIVVDDGSSDDTAAIVAPLLADRRIRYLRQANAGPAAARNRGIAAARAGLVAFLDSDNLYYPGFLDYAVAAFLADPDLDVAYGALVSEHHGLDRTNVLLRRFDREALKRANVIDTSTLVCRKAALEAVGGFDAGIFGTEDWDLVLRLTEAKPARPLPVLAALYRIMDDIRLTATIPLAERHAYVLRKHGLADKPPA